MKKIKNKIFKDTKGDYHEFWTQGIIKIKLCQNDNRTIYDISDKLHDNCISEEDFNGLVAVLKRKFNIL